MSETKFRKINNLLGWFVFSVALFIGVARVYFFLCVWRGTSPMFGLAKIQLLNRLGTELFAVSTSFWIAHFRTNGTPL